jgi:hypothetical protein
VIGNWLRNLFSGRKIVRPSSRFKPDLEALEDRLVPIAVQTYSSTLLPQALAHTLQGTGVSISNFSYTGSSLAAGTFTNGSSDVGFSSGIILDTGLVNTVASHPTTAGGTPAGANLGQAGDPIMAGTPGLTGAAYDDASIINFTLVAQGPQVNLSFAFASNEFNRGLAAGVRAGSGDAFIVTVNGVNKALVGGAAALPITPVSFLNPATNGLLRNNDPTLSAGGVGPLDVNFNDLTSVITISFSVTAGVPTPVHIAIADGGIPNYDPTVDSAVFIGAQSLMAPARLVAAFPTNWAYFGGNYIGYITILNLGPSTLFIGNGLAGGSGTSAMTVTLANMPTGVSAVNTVNNTYTITNVALAPGQSIRVGVVLRDPYHLALPTYFNTAGNRIQVALTPTF